MLTIRRHAAADNIAGFFRIIHAKVIVAQLRWMSSLSLNVVLTWLNRNEEQGEGLTDGDHVESN